MAQRFIGNICALLRDQKIMIGVPNSSELVDTFKIAVIEPDASMRHVFSQQTGIERPDG